MDIRFLTPTLHGVADYGAGAGLITLPFILNLGQSSPLALWLAVITGCAVIVVSLLTNYKLGAFRVIPFKGHLAIDLAVAVVFTIAPLALNFSGLDAYYYWANAAAVYLVVAVSHPTERTKTSLQT